MSTYLIVFIFVFCLSRECSFCCQPSYRMDLCARLKSLDLVDFTITLDGVYLHFTPDRIRMLDRIARFHEYTTTGEDIGKSPEIRLLRSVR